MSDLKELHHALLEILVDIDAVCRKYGIRYYLAYGTLLGAVRHQGFIPWDDDADIMMPRKDYDQFLNIAAEALGEKYFVQYYKTERYYRHPFAKVRRNGTACIIQDHRRIRMHQGIFVDIFPLENIPTNKFKRNLLRGIAYLTDRLCAFSIAKLPKKFFLLAPIKLGFSILIRPSTIARIGEALVRAFQVDFSDHVAYLLGSSRFVAFLYAWLGDGKDIIFEGKTLRVPDAASSCLHAVYGDFMTLPPVEHRQPSHAKDGTQVSVSRDYREFIPELYGNETSPS